MKPFGGGRRNGMQRAGKKMKKWTIEEHLSELVLERRAAGEAEADELQATDSHLQKCPACRAFEAEWRELFVALASLPALEPSRSFDDAVMARVRAPARQAIRTWVPTLARRLRPVAVGAAALWTSAVIVGVAWAQTWLDIPAGVLIAQLLAQAKQLALAAAIKIGAILHISGLADFWTQLTETVPGPGIAVAVALMTVLSGLAIWTLYRVAGYQPPRIDAHA
jgi:anti-sigma factor RsiW